MPLAMALNLKLNLINQVHFNPWALCDKYLDADDNLEALARVGDTARVSVKGRVGDTARVSVKGRVGDTARVSVKGRVNFCRLYGFEFVS